MTNVLSVKSKGFDSGARYLNKRISNIESTYAEGLAQVGSRGFVLNDSTFSVLDHNGREVFKASPDGVWVTGHDGKKLMSVDENGLAITGVFSAFDAAGSEVFYAGPDGVRLKVQAGIYATPEEVLAAQQAADAAKAGAEAAQAAVDANKQAIDDARAELEQSSQEALMAVRDAQAAADRAANRVTTFYASAEPPEAVAGNLWIDTSTTPNTLKRFDGSEWVNVTDEVLAKALVAAGDAMAAADSKVRTFAQDSAPTELTATDVGDLWVDTDDGNKMYRWSGKDWVAIQDAAIAAASEAAANAVQAAQDAATVAGVKGEVILSAEEPLVQQRLPQNLWIDTDEGNTPKMWNGSSWVAVADESVIEAANKAAAAQKAADDAMAKALEPADEIAIPKPGTTTPYITGDPTKGLNVNNEGNVEVFHAGLDGTRILGTFTAKDPQGNEIFYAGPDGVRMKTQADIMVSPEEFKAFKEAQFAQATASSDLIINGSGTLKNNTNFSGGTWNGTDVPTGSVGSFYTKSANQAFYADGLIAYNPLKAYRFSWQMRQTSTSTTAKAYGFIAPYDAEGLLIGPEHYMRHPNTITSLAQDLKPGDTVIKLKNAAEWFGSSVKPSGTNTYSRRIIFWNYRDGNGKLWGIDTYSRNVSPADFWADGAVDLATNTITLRNPFPSTWGTIPAGVVVANGASGGSFIYTPSLGNGVVPTSWTSYGDTLPANPKRPGIGKSASWGEIPPGTAQIKVGWLVNRVTDGSNSIHAIAGASFSDAVAAQAAAAQAEWLANQPADDILIKNGAQTIVEGNSVGGLNAYSTGNVEVFHAGLDGVRMTGSLTSKDSAGNVIFSAGPGGAYFNGDISSVGPNGGITIKQSLYGSSMQGIRLSNSTNPEHWADWKVFRDRTNILAPKWWGGSIAMPPSSTAMTSGSASTGIGSGGWVRGEMYLSAHRIGMDIVRTGTIGGRDSYGTPVFFDLTTEEASPQSHIHTDNKLSISSYAELRAGYYRSYDRKNQSLITLGEGKSGMWVYGQETLTDPIMRASLIMDLDSVRIGHYRVGNGNLGSFLKLGDGISSIYAYNTEGKELGYFHAEYDGTWVKAVNSMFINSGGSSELIAGGQYTAYSAGNMSLTSGNGSLYFKSKDAIDFSTGGGYVGFKMSKRSNNFGLYSFNNIPSTTYAGNCFIDSNNSLYVGTSARKYKRDIRDLERDPSDVLNLRPRSWIDWLEEDDEDPQRIFGFVAEEVRDAGFGELITYDIDGEVRGLMYDRVPALHQLVLIEMEKRIRALEERTAQ